MTDCTKCAQYGKCKIVKVLKARPDWCHRWEERTTPVKSKRKTKAKVKAAPKVVEENNMKKKKKIS